MRSYWVYILANDRPTLYIGVTGNLARRIDIHNRELLVGFTQRYHIHRLVYFEQYDDIWQALAREKRLKSWKRQWKLGLIRASNPTLRDLSCEL